MQLAIEFDLPVRMASQDTMARFGQPDLRRQIAAKGIIFPDYFVYDELKNEKNGVKAFWLDVVKNLKPGGGTLHSRGTAQRRTQGDFRLLVNSCTGIRGVYQ